MRIYDPNVATLKVRDWGHEPVTTSVTKDVFFSDGALHYPSEEDAQRPMAGAAFDTRTKDTVRNPPAYNAFSGEGPRRHLATNFSTQEVRLLSVCCGSVFVVIRLWRLQQPLLVLLQLPSSTCGTRLMSVWPAGCVCVYVCLCVRACVVRVNA